MTYLHIILFAALSFVLSHVTYALCLWLDKKMPLSTLPGYVEKLSDDFAQLSALSLLGLPLWGLVCSILQ